MNEFSIIEFAIFTALTWIIVWLTKYIPYSMAFKYQRDELLEKIERAKERKQKESTAGELAPILKEMRDKLRAKNPGPTYLNDATFIYGKALNGIVGKKEVVIFLSDMIRRMQGEEVPRDASPVVDCLNKILNLP